MADDRTYKIIRMRRDGPNEVIRGGMTLEEAQAHCQREDTHGEGWFDGYDLENPTPEELAERQAKDEQMARAIAKFQELGL
jgi:hypothetical protein